MAIIKIIIASYAIVASCYASGIGHFAPAVRSFPIVRYAPFYNFPSPVRSIHAISPAFPAVAPPFLPATPVLPAPAPLFAPAARLAPAAVAPPVFARSFPVLPAAPVVRSLAPAPAYPFAPALAPIAPAFRALPPGFPAAAYPAVAPAYPALAPVPFAAPAPIAAPAGIAPAHIAYARAFSGAVAAPPAAVLPAPPLIRQFAWKK